MTSQIAIDFDGHTYIPSLDQERLTTQLNTVFKLMSDGRWRTLAQIKKKTHFPEASISARLRDLRKVKFGGHIVNRRRVDNSGLFEYQVKGQIK